MSSKETGNSQSEIPPGWEEVDYTNRLAGTLRDGERILPGLPLRIVQKDPNFDEKRPVSSSK